jgi:hypothetical protein
MLVDFFVGPEEYEAMFGVAVHDLLASREDDDSVSQEEAREFIRTSVGNRHRT